MAEESKNQDNPENLPVPAPKAQVPIVDGKFAPTDFDGLWRIAHVMAATSMCPERYRGNTADVFVALSMGMEIGLSHMGALQNIAVVKGTPTVFADGVTGLIQGSGQLEWMQEGFKDGDKEIDPSDLPVKLNEWPDTLKAYCHMKRKNQLEIYKGSFSVADAKRMGKWMYKEKSVWSQHPARMLTWRARTWPCRDGFSDILKGLKIYEEVVDYDADMADTNGQYEVVEPEVVTKTKDEGIVKDTPQVVEDKTLFQSMCEDSNIDHDIAMNYIKEIADVTGAPIITITARAVNKKSEFIAKFDAWKLTQKEAKKPEEDEGPKPDNESGTAFGHPIDSGPEATKTEPKEVCQNCDVPDCPGCETKEMGDAEPDDVKNSSSDQPDGHSAEDREAGPDTAGSSVDDANDGQADKASVPQKTTIKKWGGLRGVDFGPYVKEHPEDFEGIPAKEYDKAIKKWNSLVYARTKEDWPLKSTEKQPEIEFPKQSMKQHLSEMRKDYPEETEKSIQFRGFGKSGLGEDACAIVVQDVVDLMGGKVLKK